MSLWVPSIACEIAVVAMVMKSLNERAVLEVVVSDSDRSLMGHSPVRCRYMSWGVLGTQLGTG